MSTTNVRQQALNESAMRARLFAKDGINGDLIEAGRAAMRALMPSGDSPKREPIAARRNAVVGEYVGNSIVGKRVGTHRNGGRLHEVTCGGCGDIQLRTSGALNYALRNGRSIECPRCFRERSNGAQAARFAALQERIRAGGPVWTTYEVMQLREAVQAALVNEFGEPVDPDDSMPLPLETANGWPWSYGARTKDAWRSIEREYQERLRETERGERRLLKYNVEVGKEAAALLAVVATGDARAMLDVLSEID